jgi:hypothetical protein
MTPLYPMSTDWVSLYKDNGKELPIVWNHHVNTCWTSPKFSKHTREFIHDLEFHPNKGQLLAKYVEEHGIPFLMELRENGFSVFDSENILDSIELEGKDKQSIPVSVLIYFMLAYKSEHLEKLRREVKKNSSDYTWKRV